MNVRIRRCEPGDYEAVTDLALAHLSADQRQLYLSNSARMDRMGQLLRGEVGVCLVAFLPETSDVVGYADGGIQDNSLSDFKYARLETIVVRVEHRGRGIGTQLARAFMTWSKEAGADRILVVASPRNEAVIRFYQRLGFVARSLELEKWDP